MSAGATVMVTVMAVILSTLLRGWMLMLLLNNLHVVGLGDVHSSYMACVGFAFLLAQVLPGGVTQSAKKD